MFHQTPARLETNERDFDIIRGRGRAANFGSTGRRQCSGDQVAFTTILLAASKIVWAFNVLAPDGGVDINIETGYKNGAVSQPIDPTVGFRLRDRGRESDPREDFGRTEAIASKILG